MTNTARVANSDDIEEYLNIKEVTIHVKINKILNICNNILVSNINDAIKCIYSNNRKNIDLYK